MSWEHLILWRIIEYTRILRFLFISEIDNAGGCPFLKSSFYVFLDESYYAVFSVSDLDYYVTENNGKPIKARLYTSPDACYRCCTLLRPVFSDNSHMLVGFIKLCDFKEDISFQQLLD